MYLYLSQNILYDATIILQFEEPLFILATFLIPHCIFVLKKLYFGVFMGESLSPPVSSIIYDKNSIRDALTLQPSEIAFNTKIWIFSEQCQLCKAPNNVQVEKIKTSKKKMYVRIKH